MASATKQLAANLQFDTFRRATELHNVIGFTVLAMIVYLGRVSAYFGCAGGRIGVEGGQWVLARGQQGRDPA